MSDIKITFQAGDVKGLNLKDATPRAFGRLHENSYGSLQGTVCTGMHPAHRGYDVHELLEDAGLTLFAPEIGSAWDSHYFLIGAIEYEIDGEVSYLFRVRQASAGDPSFREQYELRPDKTGWLRATDKCVVNAVQEYLSPYFEYPDDAVWCWTK